MTLIDTQCNTVIQELSIPQNYNTWYNTYMAKEQQGIPSSPYVSTRGLTGGDILRAHWADPAWRKWKTEVDMVGRNPSAYTRELIAAARRGVRRGKQLQETMSRKHGAVKMIAGSLLLRGGSSEEVAQITGFTKVQIDNLISNMRRPGGGLRKPSDEETSQRKRVAHLGKPRSKRGRQYRPEEKYSFAFLKSFAQDELFADLGSWLHLHTMYSLRRRELPVSFAGKLLLELFLKAMKNFAEGDASLLLQYMKLGEGIHKRWFNQDHYREERAFIRRIVLGGNMR